MSDNPDLQPTAELETYRKVPAAPEPAFIAPKVGNIQAQPPKQKLTLDFLTDKAGLHGATIASMFTVGYMQFNIMPEIFSQVIFGAIGSLFGLLYVRSIVKKAWRLFWLLFCIITFSDVSFLLALTGIQSKQAAQTEQIDPVAKALSDATATAQKNLTDLIAQQGAAQNRTTLDNISGQITLFSDILKTAQATERAYVPQRQERRIDSARVYMGIWDALVSGQIENYVKLVYSLTFSLILLLTILETAKMTAQRQRKEARAGTAVKKKAKRKPKPAGLSLQDPGT